MEMVVGIYNIKLHKLFVSNSNFLINIYFQWIIPLHPNIFKSKILFDVNPAPNYIKKLKLMEIETITLH